MNHPAYEKLMGVLEEIQRRRGMVDESVELSEDSWTRGYEEGQKEAFTEVLDLFLPNIAWDKLFEEKAND